MDFKEASSDRIEEIENALDKEGRKFLVKNYIKNGYIFLDQEFDLNDSGQYKDYWKLQSKLKGEDAEFVSLVTKDFSRAWVALKQ